jgi:glycosyltransferase involved in cell wall biosynthesis
VSGHLSARCSVSPPTAVGVASPAARPARLRLLLLLPDFERQQGEPGLVRAAPRLLAERFEVTVACLGPWGPVGDDLEAAAVRAVALGLGRAIDLRAVGRLLSILRRDRIQVVHAVGWRPSLWARLLGRLAGVPVVLTTLDAGAIAHPWRRALDRATAPLSDAIVVRSEAERRAAVEERGYGPGMVRMIRAAADVARPLPDERRREQLRRDLGVLPGDRLLGCAARLCGDGARAVERFLAAAQHVAAAQPRARFAVFGDGPGRAALERCATRAAVSHCTAFAGAREPGEAVAACDLFVQVATESAAACDGLLQAMAAGVPVVAARSAVAEEFVRDGESGVLAPAGDAGALGRACLEVLQDRERALRLGRAGRDRVAAAFGVEGMIAEATAVWRTLLRDAQRPAREREAAAAAGGLP